MKRANEWTKRNRWTGLWGIAACILSLCVSLPVLAAETGNAYCGKISEGELTVFVSDPGGTEEVLCQVGTVPCEEVHAVSQEEDGFPVETVLLVREFLISAYGVRLPPDRRQRVENTDLLRNARIRQCNFGSSSILKQFSVTAETAI